MTITFDDIAMTAQTNFGYHNNFSRRPAVRIQARIPGCATELQRHPDEGLISALTNHILLVSDDGFESDKSREKLIVFFQTEPLDLARTVSFVTLELLKQSDPSLQKYGSHCPEAGSFDVIFECRNPSLGRVAARIALRLAKILDQAEKGTDASDLVGALKDQEQIHYEEFVSMDLGQTNKALLAVADRRSIPWFYAFHELGLVQIGHCHKTHRFRETISGRDSFQAIEIAHNKALCHQVLARAGLPVPSNRRAYSKRQAIAMAKNIGYPVVLKPINRGKGLGVAIGLSSPEAVGEAYDAALQYSTGVVLEAVIAGDDHRLLVIDGKLVAAARRLPAAVIGDGIRTIAALVEVANADPRRGRGYSRVMNLIEIDESTLGTLRDQNLTLESVPRKGQEVPLKRTANISTGGSAVDVTDTIHPDNRAMAERAARLLGLNAAGVDFLTTDISWSFLESGGMICEVNASPGLRPHRLANPEFDVAATVVDSLFPDGDDGRIPIAAVTGSVGKTTTSRMLASILEAAGHRVGCTTTEEVSINGQIVARGDFAGMNGARIVLSDPDVEMAVLETARGGVIRHGIEFECCDVAAVTNVRPEHMGEYGITSLEQMAKIKLRLAKTARHSVALNAADPLCVEMAKALADKSILYVAPEGLNGPSQKHLRAGGEVVTAMIHEGEEFLVHCKGTVAKRLCSVAAVPATFGGLARHNLHNALFAAALAIGLEQDSPAIAKGLNAFTTDQHGRDGRLTFFEDFPFRVLFDFGHSGPQVEAVAAFTDRLPVQGRRIAILTAPGNRLNDHIAAVGRAAAGHFDHYIPYEIAVYRRGRAEGENSGIIAEALKKTGVPTDLITCCPDETDAIATAVQIAQPGDLVILFGHHVKTALPIFQRFVNPNESHLRQFSDVKN